MSDKKTVREELAELTEAVRDLREDEVTAELRRLRAEVAALRVQQAVPTSHHCIGCSCMRINYFPTYPAQPIPGCAPQPTQVWYGTVTSGGTSDFAMTATNGVGAAAGYNPAVDLGTSN